MAGARRLDGLTPGRTVDLSVIVVVYNMRREAPRTLHSLSRRYQRGIESIEYEVLVMENGSSEPLEREYLDTLPAEFRYVYIDGTSQSPARAVNEGVRRAKGAHVCIIVDGARILSPGMLRQLCEACGHHRRAIVATLGWHIGSVRQQEAVVKLGYDAEQEDGMLASIGWPEDGYKLFDISVFGGSSAAGFFGSFSESNCFLLRKSLFTELGGYEEAFKSPGGGLVNLDFFKRAVEHPSVRLMVLLGEGSFHQIHGGATTGGKGTTPKRFAELEVEYRTIRGEPWKIKLPEPTFYGRIRPEVLPHLRRSLGRSTE